MKMHPPLDFCAHFRIFRSLWFIFGRRLLLHSIVPDHGRKGMQMKLKIRYENEYQTVELDEKSTKEMWVSLGFEDEETEQEQKERRIQEAFDEQFNRPEYNNWHKFDRHRGYSKAQPGKDSIEDGIDSSEPLMDKVADDRIFRKDEIERKKKEDYEAACRWVCKILAKKLEWADAFIAVYLNDESIRDYAARIGADENSITHKLKRAKKKLRENYKNRQI